MSGESHASPHYVLRYNQPTVLTPEAGNGRGGVFKEPHMPHWALHSDQLTEGERSSKAPDAMTGWVGTQGMPAHNLYTSFTLRGERARKSIEGTAKHHTAAHSDPHTHMRGKGESESSGKSGTLKLNPLPSASS